MRTLRLIVMLVLVIASTTRLAESQSQPRVVFVQETDLQMASVTNQGAAGLTRLAEIFTRLGARTSFVRLDQPIPDDAQVVVLVGPRHPLSGEELARLWIHLEKGNSLLLALDPPGQAGSPDAQNGGVDRLLSTEYGVKLLNGLLIGPAFTQETILDPARSIVLAHPDSLSNPITEPLLTYGLPVYLWGARNLQAETFGLYGSATPLLVSIPAYAETNSRVYLSSKPDPLEFNIGVDYQGQLVVGTTAESHVNQSRIAVMGDSEMFENGYGLALNANTQTPIYAGDYIVAQRLASWLMKLPQDNWPTLPGGMTWIKLDGEGDDWPARAAVTPDPSGDVSILSLDIKQIRAFRNSDYLYLLVETAVPANPNSQISVDVDTNLDGKIDGTITIDAQGANFAATDGTVTALPDAGLAVGQGIEVRLPLRATGLTSRLSKVCLSVTQLAFAPEPDCAQSIAVPQLAQQDPMSLRLFSDVVGIITTPNIGNLRSSPSTTGRVVTTVRNGDVFAAIGRNTAGDWIEVQNARSIGWVSAPLIALSGDAQMLPVVSSP